MLTNAQYKEVNCDIKNMKGEEEKGEDFMNK